MQVFISDLHLTDGTSGITIDADAFKLLRDDLNDLIQKRGSKELRIVLLGDIFDIIRSTKWLASSVRPWSEAGPAQEAIVQNIVDDIIIHNQQSLNWIKSLKQLVTTFDLQYIIGNHDWLINRYDSIVKTVASALDITPPPAVFLEEISEPAYKTFARHGDKYDKTNYMKNRNESSIGDAIVIELLNKFPVEVGKKLPGLVASGNITPKQMQTTVDELKELDNVRPMSDIPSWMLKVLNHSSTPIQQVIIEAWCECVDEFLKVDFVRKAAIFTVNKLWTKWRFFRYLPKFMLNIAAMPILGLQCLWEVRYDKKAWAEPMIHSKDAKYLYVIYGHTHEHTIVPMAQVRLSNGTEDKIYFNTGTWRQTWNKAVFDKGNIEFIGWKVLTYIAFYKENENEAQDGKNENKTHKFDVWNGALG
jgi:UDP-2,3-diacylglucosamine pyrophosphatase LpxH